MVASAQKWVLLNCLLFQGGVVDAFVSPPPINANGKVAAASTATRHNLAAMELADGYNEMLAQYPLVTSSFTSGCLSGLGDAIAQHKEGREQGPPQVEEEKRSKWLPQIVNFDTKRNRRFIIKGLGGGLIWLFWFRLADEITQSAVMPFTSLGGISTDELVLSSTSGSLPEQATAIIIGTTILSILLDQFLASPVVFALWDIPVPILLSKSMEEESTETSPPKQQQQQQQPQQEDLHVHIPQQIQDKLGGLLVANAKIWTFANAIIYNLPLEYRVVASSVTDLVWQSIVSSHVNTDSRAAAVPVPDRRSSPVLF
ncbi:expressed unknown protein [Seminavis robusta]|uniref:Uncharacterized protein n=1 Tax=Seminavis robusta TaxID=568900 RepID=A0A9N8EVH3_9STRA|nr:expressed unknown protein [Seminavis robusta]|eukprot:Sro1804_g298690.1 n/a (314) ;mRNA; r:14537-15478